MGVNSQAFLNGDINFLSGRTEIPGFTDLSPREIAIFDADLRRLAFMISLERDLSNLMLSQRDAYLFAASIAKAQFKNLTFGGLLGGGGFNMQILRPTTILGNVPVTIQTNGGGGAFVGTWKTTYVATGWQAIFGSDSTQVSLGNTGPATTTTTTYSRVMICVPYLLSTGASPKVVEIRVKSLQTTYPTYVLHWMTMTDLFIAKLPGQLLQTTAKRGVRRDGQRGNDW